MQNAYKVRMRHLYTTRTMESKVALLLIVGLLYAVHQTSAGESQSLLLRASATLHEKSPEIILRPSDPLHMNEESVTSVLLRPHVHINEGGLGCFREVVEACVLITRIRRRLQVFFSDRDCV